MRVAVEVVGIQQLLVQVALVAVVQVVLVVVELVETELQTQEVVVEVEAVAVLRNLALAAQASSSFHTQAQHNYLVVELLPNQAVSSFTHSHLLAHLALCHL
jgi:hypothetical protein